MHKSADGVDEVLVDLSPLRLGDAEALAAAAAFCLAQAPDGVVEGSTLSAEPDSPPPGGRASWPQGLGTLHD